MNFKNIFFILCLSLLFSSCSVLQGSSTVANNEYLHINQSQIENNLLENTSLKNQNLSLSSSLLVTLDNLKNLQKELDSLDLKINQINSDLAQIKEKNKNDDELVTYLDTLNDLTEKSKYFVVALRDSTVTWDSYLSTALIYKDNLNFTKPVNETVFVDSVTNPLEAFN